jgi:ADP-ribosylglycohydrolase
LIDHLARGERILGCVLGDAVGDALGAPVEFLWLSQIQNHFGASGIADVAEAFGRVGAITDDTQMTLFTAKGARDAASVVEGLVDAAYRGRAGDNVSVIALRA